jgi:hypothetical protein
VENRATTQDVTIGTTTYRLSKTDARQACWLFAILGAHAGNGTMLAALGKLTHAEFDEVQGIALRLVCRMDQKEGNDFPMPIIGGSGAWGDAELSCNAAHVFKLTAEVLMFNLAPFFPANGSSSPPLDQ